MPPIVSTARQDVAQTEMAAPKGIIFDWDNTLVDSWVCIHEAINRTLAHMGHPVWNMADMKDRVALSLRDSFPRLFGDRWEEAREVFYAAFAAIHLDYLKPLPGVIDMLKTLVAGGVRLSVVSNKNGSFLREEVACLNWGGFFDRLVGATDAAEDKPAAAPVTLACAAMGCGEDDPVWFVGDAAVDMECALNTCCVPVLLRADQPRPGEFDRYPFRWHLKNCVSLTDLVRELGVPISAN
ncbi:HAD hydrolase-like protein [Telmatospirillum sp.]|uniref:HAD family hydrolase n=1 Tax=Telmatospirillum sp. TaxID=2079197 RepID=UPI002847F28B|nr:HAD hydrolase-like protein [Telmatospirillum sp.]MDR3439463.1 HAD hydrolase-like protein [Telmatospirillum sp.]